MTRKLNRGGSKHDSTAKNSAEKCALPEEMELQGCNDIPDLVGTDEVKLGSLPDGSIAAPPQPATEGTECERLGLDGGGVVIRNVEEMSEDEETCSWGPFKPNFCQRFRDPKIVLLCLCLANATVGMVVNGFNSVVLTTLEKRFGLRSTEAGIVSSFYDIASVVCLIPISYFGATARKPRWVGYGMITMALGSALFALPHFTVGKYEYHDSGGSNILCQAKPNQTMTGSDQVCIDEAPANTELRNYKYNFILGNALHGIGATPLLTLSVIYLDENLKARNSPLYVGIFYAQSMIGPAIGYLLGGAYLKQYVDTTQDPTKIDITPESTKWVGAWWIGYLQNSILALLFSIPLIGFPRSLPVKRQKGVELVEYVTPLERPHMIRAQQDPAEEESLSLQASIGESSSSGFSSSPDMIATASIRTSSVAGSSKLQKDRASEVYAGSEVQGNTHAGFGAIRDIPGAIKVLILNPTFLFLNLAGASEALLVSGFVAFTPKFLESQFNISAGLAGQLVGLVTVPAGGGGTFLGGYLVKRFDMHCASILKFCICTSFVSLMLIMVFLCGCPNVPFAGVNQPYNPTGSTSEIMAVSNLSAACNSNCQCLRSHYDPVCGDNGKMYFSPCYAGCSSTYSYNTHGKKVYSNCSCIEDHHTGTPFKTSVKAIATEGKCIEVCGKLALFLPIFGCAIFVTWMASMPALSATLRCIPEKQRSFGLGIQWLLIRCLGSISAPIIFGALIDKTCQLWQSPCMGEGTCLVYDNITMGHYLLLLSLLGKGFSFLFFFLALTLYRPPPAPSSEVVTDG